MSKSLEELNGIREKIEEKVIELDMTEKRLKNFMDEQSPEDYLTLSLELKELIMDMETRLDGITKRSIKKSPLYQELKKRYGELKDKYGVLPENEYGDIIEEMVAV